MALDLDMFGVPGQWLKRRGWTIVPSDRDRGTAAADGRNKRILMRPDAYARPSLRVRRYVVPHEIWHGVHYEVSQYSVDDLMVARSLDRRSAIEVVADGACLRTDRSKAMRTWVTSSVVWHGKVGYRYTVRDLSSPAALTIIDGLIVAVHTT